jgi:hypothetical protein
VFTVRTIRMLAGQSKIEVDSLLVKLSSSLTPISHPRLLLNQVQNSMDDILGYNLNASEIQK